MLGNVQTGLTWYAVGPGGREKLPLSPACKQAAQVVLREEKLT